MSAMPPSIGSFDKEGLVESLKKKRCVLMLGPRIATVVENGHEVPIMEGLALEFARKLDAQNVSYEKSAAHNLPYVSQLLLREQNMSKEDLCSISQKYVVEKSGSDDYIPSIYKELANLPVRIIVNTTPDDFMLRALKKAGKMPESYNFNYEVNSGSERNEQQDPVNYNRIGVMQPLVFNLFGNTKNANSMVITESDQMTFIRNVVKGSSSIPPELLGLFQSDNTYLFFGFNLENWQFRLLMKSLQLSEKNRTLSPQTDNYPVTEITKTYLRHEFNFHFVDKRMADFAGEIGTLASGIDAENVFISHSNTDEDNPDVKRLIDALKPLKIIHPRLRIWHRGDIVAGDVEQQVKEEIQKANIIIPLLSLNYLSTDAIINTDLPLIQSRFNEGLAEVAPIVLKPCLWDAIPFFLKPELERLPHNNLRSVVDGELPEDEAFRTIAAAFKKRFL